MRNSLKFLSLMFVAFALVSCGDDDASSPITIDPSALSFDTESLALLENGGETTINLTFENPAPVEGTITINLSGTATYGDDYTTVPAATDGAITLNFAEGDVTKSVAITPVADDTAEDDETILVGATTSIEAFDLAGLGEVTVNLIDVDRTTFVALRRSNGVLYQVDPTSGATTFSKIIVDESMEPLTNLRGLVYDYATDQAFVAAGGGDAKAGYLYGVDLSTGEASVLNAKDPGSATTVNGWSGFGNISIQNDELIAYAGNVTTSGEILVRNEGVSSFTGILGFDKADGSLTDASLTTAFCCNGGMTTQDDDSVLVAQSGDGLYFQSYHVADAEEGSFKNASFDDVASFTSDFADFNTFDIDMRTLSTGVDGTIYGILDAYDYEGESIDFLKTDGFESSTTYQFLVTVNPLTGAIGYVGLMGTSEAERFDALAEVPAYLVKPVSE